MTYYHVDLRIGTAHSWQITRAAGPGQLSDDLRVLDGLRFGWSMPDGLWPQQPDPATAAFALTVPDASVISDMAEGDPVSIEVTIHPLDTVPAFTFYGRLSDLQVIPRDGRDGVTLSVVAVDYVPDWYELEQIALGWNGRPGDMQITEALDELWAAAGLGLRPAWPSDRFNDLDINPGPDPLLPGEILTEFLAEVIGFSDDEERDRRLIIAPNIDPVTREPDATQPWALDVVTKHAEGTPFVIDSHMVERGSIVWRFRKWNAPTKVDAVGFNQNAENIVSASHGFERWSGRVKETISVPSLVNSGDAEAVADFYLPPEDVSRWQVEAFRYLVSRHDEDELEGLYPPLMPRHTAGAADRSACYGLPVQLTDVPAHRSPIESYDDTITGRLCSAELTINARHLSVDMQLRQPVGAEAP